MHDSALEVLHPRPFRRVAFGVAVIPLAHPQEVGGETKRQAGIGPHRVDRPQLVLARPLRRGDLVAIADMLAEVVLLDYLAHVFADCLRRRDRRAGPGLEAIAEGVQVAVGPYPRILMRQPGAAEAALLLQHHEARPLALLGQVIRPPNPGNSRPDDQHVEVLRRLRHHLGRLVHRVHRFFSLLGG